MSDDTTITVNPAHPRPRDRMVHALVEVHPRASRIELDQGEQTVGRAPPVPFALRYDDPAMSRAHARITVAHGRATVTDLESHNGTWCDGLRSASALLTDGCVLRLGGTFLVYRHESDDLLDAEVDELIGSAPCMRILRLSVAQVAPTNATVVLTGETGTGKTVTARAIHRLSGRKGNFIHVNCAAIPENIAESELFGHKAGAFTDARSDKLGLFRDADNGTLLLDEVALLSPASQARLLLVLESGIVTPVGASSGIKVDVRVIAATNENLAAKVRAGQFRADLYARLFAVPLHMPPLRERREDILPLLYQAWGAEVPPKLSTEVVARILSWSWPFNVREVQQLATELKIRSGAGPIDAQIIAERLRLPDGAEAEPAAEVEGVGGPPSEIALRQWLSEVDGNVAELARRVGRSTKQVYRWCARHGIDPATFRKRTEGE